MVHPKVFVLGLGNQKCGTTWLHSYLKKNESFEGGFAKEFHIWDSLDIPCIRDASVSWKRRLAGLPTVLRRSKMMRDPDFYFDYFDGLYSDKVTISGDITPSYSGLEPTRLEFIRDQFASRNVLVKPVILIRDPLARIKSAVRYSLSRKNYSEGITPGETDFNRALKQYYTSEHCRLRTAYHVGISNARQVFGDDGVYVGVYENMFDDAEVERVSRFCGVPADLAYSGVFVNKTKNKAKTNDLKDKALDEAIREAYQDTYRYCFDEFPATKELWT